MAGRGRLGRETGGGGGEGFNMGGDIDKGAG